MHVKIIILTFFTNFMDFHYPRSLRFTFSARSLDTGGACSQSTRLHAGGEDNAKFTTERILSESEPKNRSKSNLSDVERILFQYSQIQILIYPTQIQTSTQTQTQIYFILIKFIY